MSESNSLRHTQGHTTPYSQLQTMIYLQDTFQGTAGTLLSAHTSDSVAQWITNGGQYTLDGNGYVYANTNNPNPATSNASLPGSLAFQLFFDCNNLGNVGTGACGVQLARSSSNGYQFLIKSGVSYFTYNGSSQGTSGGGPGTGVIWRIFISVQVLNGNLAFSAQYAPAPFTNWSALASYSTSNYSGFSPHVDIWCPNTNPTQTTGFHFGNLLLEDLVPTATIGVSYVACSGQSLALFPANWLSGSQLNPTALNTMPTVQINGGTAFQPVNYLCPPNGTSSCILLALPAPYQVNPGDVVSVTAPAGWLTTSGGATGALSIANMTNAVMAMPPPVASVVPTFKPGFNLSSSILPGGKSVLLRNLRYRTGFTSGIGSQDSGGYPTTLSGSTAQGVFMNLTGGTNLPGDNTQLPGIPGYYGVIYDDNAYGTNNQCNISLSSPNTTQSTVSLVSTFTNAGSGGIGQAAVYKVTQSAGSTTANIPVQHTWTMPHWSSTSKSPSIANMVIVGPRDLVTRYTGSITVTSGATAVSFGSSQTGLTGLYLWVDGDTTLGLYQVASGSGTSWTLATAYGGASGTFKAIYWGTLPNGPITIDRSQPYALSRYFTDWFPNGVGVLRWMDATCGFASGPATRCPNPGRPTSSENSPTPGAAGSRI